MKQPFRKGLLLLLTVVSSYTMAAPIENPLHRETPLQRPRNTVPAAQPASNTSGSNGNAILQQIKVNTDLILSNVNKIPSLITEFLKYKENITRVQESGKKPEALMFSTQTYWDTLGQYFQYGLNYDPSFKDAITDNIKANNEVLVSLQQDAFATSQTVGTNSFDASSFASSKKNQSAPILSAIPNVDDLAYTNAIGFPPIVGFKPSSKNQIQIDSSVKNYIKAAGGANLFHPQLASQSTPITIAQKQYQAQFNLAYAVQSFNTYVLSKYIVNEATISQTQSTLYRKASGSDYLTTISSEPIGYVLRDILLFQSQNYVLTTRLIELQREILMAHVMTNALLIASNRQAESLLFDKTQT